MSYVANAMQPERAWKPSAQNATVSATAMPTAGAIRGMAEEGGMFRHIGHVVKEVGKTVAEDVFRNGPISQGAKEVWRQKMQEWRASKPPSNPPKDDHAGALPDVSPAASAEEGGMFRHMGHVAKEVGKTVAEDVFRNGPISQSAKEVWRQKMQEWRASKPPSNPPKDDHAGALPDVSPADPDTNGVPSTAQGTQSDAWTLPPSVAQVASKADLAKYQMPVAPTSVPRQNPIFIVKDLDDLMQTSAYRTLESQGRVQVVGADPSHPGWRQIVPVVANRFVIVSPNSAMSAVVDSSSVAAMQEAMSALRATGMYTQQEDYAAHHAEMARYQQQRDEAREDQYNLDHPQWTDDGGDSELSRAANGIATGFNYVAKPFEWLSSFL